MGILDLIEDRNSLELYKDIDEELLDRVTKMEMEYLFPDKIWDELSPEDKVQILQEYPHLADYYE